MIHGKGLSTMKRNPTTILIAYSKRYNCVEVDQWFWSLFPGGKVVLPRPEVVQEYADSLPNGFKSCVKVPNNITLTHHYKEKKTAHVGGGRWTKVVFFESRRREAFQKAPFFFR